jgi:hypothetical protein
MTNQEQIKLRLEERLRVDPIFREMWPKLLAIPLKRTEVWVRLDGKFAEAARANPDNVEVRVTIRLSDQTTLTEPRPRSGIVQVTEERAHDGREGR